MIGIVVAAHGKMSKGIIDAAELIIGGTDDIVPISLEQQDDVSLLQEKIIKGINKVNKDEGVIIFTDLFGASPYNQSTLAIRSLPIEIQNKTTIITGVNLPMLLEAINQKMIDSSIESAITAILDTSKQSTIEWSLKDEEDDLEIDEEDEF